MSEGTRTAREPKDGHEKSREAEHGRYATKPHAIPAPGWRDVVVRVWRSIGNDHVSLVSAGLAMYGLLAIFPGLAAAVSIYGMFSTPAAVVNHLQIFSGVLPPGTWDLLRDQLQNVARRSSTSLSLTAAATLLIALWGARSGIGALMVATNIAYSEKETRGIFRQYLVSLALTIGAIVGFIVVLAIGVGLPVALKILGTNPLVGIIVNVLRWILLWLMVILGLAIVYRYGPARRRARWRWVTAGSVVASTLWIVVSLGFSAYVSSFASYGKTYGTLGGVIALLMWLYLSNFVIVLGAEVNAELERQTRRDSTEGPEKPLGRRGAFAADTVGPAVGEHHG